MDTNKYNEIQDIKYKANYHINNAARELQSLRWLLENIDLKDENKREILNQIDSLRYFTSKLQDTIKYLEAYMKEEEMI